jgi:hypothetical protein
VIDSFVLLAPLYLLGVIALLGFVGCFTKPPRPEEPPPFIIEQIVGDIRNDSAWFGMTIVVGPEKLVVHALGRYFIQGNGGTHRLRIVDPAGPTDIALTMVNMAQGPDEPDHPYVYGYLTSPFPTLNPGAEYHVLSEEIISGDQFHDQNTVVHSLAKTVPDAVVRNAVSSDAPGVFVPIPGPEHSYGPVNFRYLIDFDG